MAKEIYSRIFDTYGLKTQNNNEKNKYRKYIKRELERSFPDREWSDLTDLEKSIFICIDIKSQMLDYISDNIKKKIVEEKINGIIGKSMLMANKALLEHNKKVDIEFKNDYYNKNASDDDNKKGYDGFCRDLSTVNKKCPIPSFDEWIQRNKTAIETSNEPLRIYDFLMAYYYEPDNKEYPSQAEIDHVVVEVLTKIIEKGFKVKINIPRIEDCLAYIKEYNVTYDESERQLIEYDPSLEDRLSKEEQLEIISNNKKFATYETMLENLDFYTNTK